MQGQPKIIAENKECPICRPNFLKRFLLRLLRKPYQPETVTQKATKDLKEAGRIPKEAFTSAERLMIPLTDPRVALSVETLLMHYDACAKCGMRYCTRAEVVIGMVQIRQQPKGIVNH